MDDDPKKLSIFYSLYGTIINDTDGGEIRILDIELMFFPEGWNIMNLVFQGCKVNLLALNHVATRFRYIFMLNKESVVIIIEAEEENRVEGAKISLLCMRKRSGRPST